ncbi:MAG: epoxide hydrolase [Ilumatobacteraceae bacterium]|nr:epoxide hydrolase [Ilumatobacteraceae bacterium]
MSGWPEGVAHERIAVNGVELDVHTTGDPTDPTVLLCHGFPELAYSWRHQMVPLAASGYHVVAPDQRGYGRSSTPEDVAAYGIEQLSGDLTALLDHYGKDDAVFVGHDWGALIVWDAARLHASRVRAVVGVSVPFVSWPGPPTDLFRALYGDRFFYMLYFQPVGPAERELDADPRTTMATVLYGASGVGFAARDTTAEVPPMVGTGFLTMMPAVPPLPFRGPEGPWLTEDDLDEYTAGFTASGFFGPVSYYRNLDANYELMKGRGPEQVTMPSGFICGEADPVRLMDLNGIERMTATLPDFRGGTLLAGSGHWTQQESPDAFNVALLAFLAEL